MPRMDGICPISNIIKYIKCHPVHQFRVNGVIPFLDILVIKRRRHWSQNSTENPPTLTEDSTSVLTIHRVWKKAV
jgi:hypothetical protein